MFSGNTMSFQFAWIHPLDISSFSNFVEMSVHWDKISCRLLILICIFVYTFKVFFSRSQRFGMESCSLSKPEFHMQKWNMRFHRSSYNFLASWLQTPLSCLIRVRLECDNDATWIRNLMQDKCLKQLMKVCLNESFPRTGTSLQSLFLANPTIDEYPVISSSHSRNEPSCSHVD